MRTIPRKSTAWKVKKYGADYRRQWRKLHLGIDVESMGIRAMEVTDNRTGDATMLPELLSQIPETEELATVTADGAYDTRLGEVEPLTDLCNKARLWPTSFIQSETLN